MMESRMIDPIGHDPSINATGWTARLVLSTIFLAMVLEALSLGAIMLSIGLPSILAEIPTTQGGWLLTVYFLAGAVSAPLLGKAADLYGKRRTLLVTMLISTIGCIVCALAPNLVVLLIGRALQGVVMATLTLVPSLIRDIYPPRPAAFAASATVTGMGAFSVVAPFFIGWLLTTWGFRGMFWFDAAWTFSLCLMIRFVTPESPLRRDAKPDLLGGLLLAVGVVAVLMYVSLAASWGWLSPTGVLLGATGACLLVLFVLHTRRSTEPIVNLGLFKRRSLAFVAVGGATAYGLSATISQVVPLLAMTPREVGITYGLGLSPVVYATIETPRALATVAAGIVIGFLLAQGRNPRIFLSFGLIAWGIGALLLAFRNDTFSEILLGAIALGLGGGLVNSSVPNLVMRATPASDQGATAGAVQLVQTGVGATLPVIMFAILASHATITHEQVVYAETGFRNWLLIASGLSVLALLLGITFFREKGEDDPVEFSVNDDPKASGASVTDQHNYVLSESRDSSHTDVETPS
ncbi:MFS transporter [Rhodococcus ruber BKS 20-38]|uniref:MFS transporter n=2 Tax=Rhodococcus ruber TaxID=1830 RepID=M3A4F4_9NOCA|nr:MFS transporter [Rhodococcus ruber BKS 20-38]